MQPSRKSLFDQVVDVGQLHRHFENIRTLPGHESARLMLDDIFEGFNDPDGNFLEQFQTTGFDARLFELYLFAYFSRSGYVVDRTHNRPDFLVSREGATVAVEATTVNPSTSGVLSRAGRKIDDLAPEELKDYQANEMAIRFGGPLFNKFTQALLGTPALQGPTSHHRH